MTDLRAAAQQALEALCSAVEPKKGKVYARGFEPIDCYAMHEQAITALREALEQPEQEPCIGKDPRCPCQDGDACHYKDCKSTKALPVPVAQRPWQGLTDEEVQFYIKKHSKLVNAGYDKVTDTNLVAKTFDSTGFYKEVSTVLKERNT